MDWIVTADPVRETWKRIKEFANEDIALDWIAGLHGKANDERSLRNYRKQATQIRQSILQAEEYFVAARSVTTYTQPNLLYYGLVSLASAIMLLRGDGRYSLDRLRQEPSNRSHGLYFTTAARRQDCATGIALLDNSWVEVLGTGHFANWYAALPKIATQLAKITRSMLDRSTVTYDMIGEHRNLEMNELRGMKWSLSSLIQYVPDLVGHLSRFGIDVVHSRINHEVIEHSRTIEDHSWRVHGAGSPDRLQALLDQFKFHPSLIESVQCSDLSQAGCVINLRIDTSKNHPFSWPDIRYTQDLRGYIFLSSPNMFEFVELYLASFALSMLARYYPDLWISCIDSHCRSAKIIETLLTIIQEKAPLLALSFLRNDHVVIATYRAPWQG